MIKSFFDGISTNKLVFPIGHNEKEKENVIVTLLFWPEESEKKTNIPNLGITGMRLTQSGLFL